MMVSTARNGNMYFSGVFNGQRGVFRCEYRSGKYAEMAHMPEEINSIRPAHPFIAPDESFMIMDAQVTGMGKPELFVSFRKADGSWTRAVNMGPEINATKTEFAAMFPRTADTFSFIGAQMETAIFTGFREKSLKN